MKTVHISGSTASSTLGIVMPSALTVNFVREQRSGDWMTLATRNVMSTVLDLAAAGYRVEEVLEGAERVTLNEDGSRAVVRSDLDYIGQRSLQFAWEGSGLTYKLRFRVAR